MTTPTPPVQWPKDVPDCLSKTQLKPILVRLLEPSSVVREFNGIALSAWPNAKQVIHYLVDCRRADNDETTVMCNIAREVIAAAKLDKDIRSRWEFLAASGLNVSMGVYQDPGLDCLCLQIGRNPEAEARLRAGLATDSS